MRQSSDEMVALAQRVMRMRKVEGGQPVSNTGYNLLLDNAQSLAGSVLSQARPGPVKKAVNWLLGRKERDEEG